MLKQIKKIFSNLPYGVCRFSSLKKELIPCQAINRIPQDAKSIIVVAFPYKVKEQKPKNISRYAAVADYHEICIKKLSDVSNTLKKLFPNETFEPFCDNSPVPEVKAAALSGIGVVGKNGLLITEEYGSFVFLGEIITTADIDCNEKLNFCIGCSSCEDHCPTNSIIKNKENCLSAITQKKGELSLLEEELITNSGCVWGCDICQDVCPMNKKAKITSIKEFTQSYYDQLVLDDNMEHRVFYWRGKKVIERNLNLLK